MSKRELKCSVELVKKTGKWQKLVRTAYENGKPVVYETDHLPNDAVGDVVAGCVNHVCATRQAAKSFIVSMLKPYESRRDVVAAFSITGDSVSIVSNGFLRVGWAIAAVEQLP